MIETGTIKNWAIDRFSLPSQTLEFVLEMLFWPVFMLAESWAVTFDLIQDKTLEEFKWKAGLIYNIGIISLGSYGICEWIVLKEYPYIMLTLYTLGIFIAILHDITYYEIDEEVLWDSIGTISWWIRALIFGALISYFGLLWGTLLLIAIAFSQRRHLK